MTIRSFGERALLVELEQRVDATIAATARAIADAWEATGHGVAVPAYASVLLRFDPIALAPTEAERIARELTAALRPAATLEPREHVIPVSYDGQDLALIAERSRLSVDELIAAHTGRIYTAFFLGFMPGFAYLGTLDPRIDAPRLPIPRARVPRGSVAIADGQTAVYPLDSPGGWRLIGHTRRTMFDPAEDPPALIRSGDRVRFVRT